MYVVCHLDLSCCLGLRMVQSNYQVLHYLVGKYQDQPFVHTWIAEAGLSPGRRRPLHLTFGGQAAQNQIDHHQVVRPVFSSLHHSATKVAGLVVASVRLQTSLVSLLPRSGIYISISSANSGLSSCLGQNSLPGERCPRMLLIEAVATISCAEITRRQASIASCFSPVAFFTGLLGDTERRVRGRPRQGL